MVKTTQKINKRLKIGWFSFTCSGDSTIIFCEMLNDNFFKWRRFIDFRHFQLLKKKNTMRNLDVAFVEGAISSYKEERLLKRIRKNCKRLVAVGSCAVNGSPSNQRNFFDEETKKEIEFLIKRFKCRERVSPLSEIVKVDDIVPGCPMNEEIFVQVLNKYLKEFKVV